MVTSIAFLGSYFEKPQEEMPSHKAPFLSDKELAQATAKFVIPCNDIYFVDSEGKIILAKRRHAAAEGWWIFGGSATTGLTANEAVAKILKREIGFVPEGIRPLAIYEHHWADCRERPGEYRQDRILAWIVRVDEETIAKIELDPDEYYVEEGLMRFDGSQDGLRQVLYDMLVVIHQSNSL